MLETLLQNFTPEQLTRIGIVTALATVPTLVWMGLIFKGRKTSRLTIFLAFFLGTLTVLPILGLQYLWVWFPELDVYRAIDMHITEVHAAAFAALIFVGFFEELAKSGVVRIIGKTKIGIHTINDAVKYSILAGLGFAFTENIFYFYYIWQDGGFAGLIFPMIFRSIFTVCAHMVFSGIYGYFYGIARFSRPIMEQKLWMGEKSRGVKFMTTILGGNEADSYRQMMLLKGLFIAMILHALFNFSLEFSQFIPVVIIVGSGFIYLLYLLAHKAGAITFVSSGGQQSGMAKKDQDVVLELLGMWTKEGRYKDVIDICQRLLMRDPNNNVVKLFQAKAMDKAKLSKLENSFMSVFQAGEESGDDYSLRTLVKQKVLMEMLREKEGEKVQQTATQVAAQQAANPTQAGGPKIPTVVKPPTETT